MSIVGDMIVQGGPVEEPMRLRLSAAEVNALREDLIALACLRERVPRWVEMVGGDVDWSRGEIATALNEMREWVRAAGPQDQPTMTTETSASEPGHA